MVCTKMVVSIVDTLHGYKHRSHDSLIETTYQFTNCTGKVIVLYWINYDGALEKYKRMNNGAAFMVGTFVTHPWVAVVADTGDLCALHDEQHNTVGPVLLPTRSNTTDVFDEEEDTLTTVRIAEKCDTLHDQCVKVVRNTLLHNYPDALDALGENDLDALKLPTHLRNIIYRHCVRMSRYRQFSVHP